jgi:hypothetical protein
MRAPLLLKQGKEFTFCPTSSISLANILAGDGNPDIRAFTDALPEHGHNAAAPEVEKDRPRSLGKERTGLDLPNLVIL